jgi:hypothetical protein
LSISRIFVEKNKISLESDNNGYFTCRLAYNSDNISLDYPYDDVSDTKYGRARQTTDDNTAHALCMLEN